MKVFRNKITMKLGESQSDADSAVLIRNAKAAGLSDAEIEIIDMTPAGYKATIDAQNYDNLPKERKDERKIQKEIKKLNREQAIESLKQKGEL